MDGITIEQVFVIVAGFLLVSILASKASVKSGIPALLLFLGLGMLAGSDGPGRITFDFPQIAQAVGTVSLAFILFSGGLDTAWRDIRPVLKPGVALATVGVTITAVTVGLFAQAVLGFTFAEGVLLGAIISSTDAAAVFGILRGKGVNLRGRLKPLLELESGSNDPMAIFLTVGMIQLLSTPEASVLTLIPLFVMQMGIGAAMGLLIGRLSVIAINRVRLEYDGLYPVLSIALVALTFGVTAVIGGNGFLAVYLAGLVMGQKDFIHRRSLLQFHDGLAWLMQIIMFVTLGLQVFPSRLPSVALDGLAVALFLIIVARPVSVFIALSTTRITLREKVFISWVGLRGAAPIVLATFPLLAGLTRADEIFHLVFFIVLSSVLVQGTLIAQVARLLGVYKNEPLRRPSPLASVLRDGRLSNELIEVTISPGSQAIGQRLLDLQLPTGALVVLVGRRDQVIVPSGGTVLQEGDQVLVIATDRVRDDVCARLDKSLAPAIKALI